MIAIVDYDTGNLRSVCNVLDRIGAEYCITDHHSVINKADKVLLPGVGEASSAMQKLNERGLCDVIKALRQPVLGICIGLQLMCNRSEEGNAKCLGIFDTDVRKFLPSPANRIKVPHMGWNALQITNPRSKLLTNTKEGDYVYFVHSYYADTTPEATAATTEYGISYASAVASGNVMGTQFHPEKSGDAGIRILGNFVSLCE